MENRQDQPASPRLAQHLLCFLIALISVSFYLSPLLLDGRDVNLRIHDNLDQTPLAMTQIFRESSLIFSDGVSSERLMNAQYAAEPKGPRIHQGEAFYFLLEPFQAYLATQYGSRLLAFFSMYLLLGGLLGARGSLLVRCGVSILFACLPHYPPQASSVALVPLSCWSVLALSGDKGRWYHWAALIPVVVFSQFVLTTLFLVPVLVTALLLVSLWKKKLMLRPIVAAIALAGLSVGKDLAKILAVLGTNDYVSHRTEFGLETLIGFRQCLGQSWTCFRIGQSHVMTFHNPVIWYALIVISAGALFLRFRASRGEVFDKKLVWSLCLTTLCIVFSLIFGFSDSSFMVWARHKLPLLQAVQLRFYWLLPPLWYVNFALALELLGLTSKRRLYHSVATVLLGAQFFVLYTHSDGARSYRDAHPSFGSFFAERQFTEIQNFIQADCGLSPSQYRVVSLGLHPSIALYNGFYCLDGYVLDYALPYKHQFRRVIEAELERDSQLTEYFDKWGGRCYLFSSELGRDYLYTKDRYGSIESYRLGSEAFREMGGRYVLSAVEIRDPESSNLILRKVFLDPKSAWRIHLYELSTT